MCPWKTSYSYTLHINQQNIKVTTTIDSSSHSKKSSKQHDPNVLPVPAQPIFIQHKHHETFISQNIIILGPIVPVY